MTKYFEKIIALAAWLEIVISITLLGIIISAPIYLIFKTTISLIISCLIILISLITSILIANHYHKNKKTLWLISRNSASPELDDLE